jgi:hypothetical protein
VGTLTETITERATHRYSGGARAAVALSAVQARELDRLPTGIGELTACSAAVS